MGLFGGSSKSTSAGSSGGAQTQLGDPLHVSLTAGDDLAGATLNIQSTSVVSDFGAIGKAFDYADRQNSRSINLANKALNVGSKSQARAHQLAQTELQASKQFSQRIINAGLETVDILAERVADQGQQFTGAVADLSESFQEFVNRENNPGERVNLYLLAGLTVVSLAVVMGSKK